MNAHSEKVYNVMVYLGYPEDFATLIAREMSTEYTAGRIIAYFGRAGRPPLEEVADEMLAIKDLRDRLVDKHISEHANQSINELYRNINED